MADDNSQNTIAGTTGGAPLESANGNWFISSLTGLANVLPTVAGAYSSFQEANATNKLAEAQLVTPPQQATPAYQVSNAADFFSDPARIKTAAIYALAATFAIGGVIFLAKRA